jgi:methionyl aminopeptidase
VRPGRGRRRARDIEIDRLLVQKDVLTEGLVLTIEPMISAGSGYPLQDADGWTLRTKDGSLSAHHEHTLVITKGAPIVLTDRAA